MLQSTANEVRKSLALAYRCNFDVPDFEIVTNDVDLDILRMNPYNIIVDDVVIKLPSLLNFDYCLYYDGEFKNPIAFFDDNNLLSGEMGGTVSHNLVTAIPLQLKLKQLPKLKEFIDQCERDFKGFVTINFTVANKQLYYTGINFKLSHDYLYNIMNLCGYESEEDFAANLDNLNEPKGISVSTRLYTYPYDIDDNILTVKPFAIEFGFIECPECFITLNHSDKVHIKDVWSKLYKSIDNIHLKHSGIVYNTDGGNTARKVYAELHASKLIKNVLTLK